jgi:hypothetical protein
MKKYVMGLVALFMLMAVGNESYANGWVAVPVVSQQVVYQPVVVPVVQYYYVPVAPVVPILIYNPNQVWYRYKPCCY